MLQRNRSLRTLNVNLNRIGPKGAAEVCVCFSVCLLFAVALMSFFCNFGWSLISVLCCSS